MFNIIFDEKVLGFLSKLDIFLSKRILKKIGELEKNPFLRDVKRLKGEPLFRLRVGDYRVIFEIDKNTIKILKIGHRKNIY